jgi:hypothetical protein
MVASGEITALVACGARHMYGLQQERILYAELDRLKGEVAEHSALIASLVAGGDKKEKPKSDNPFHKLLGDNDDADKAEDKEKSAPEKSEDKPAKKANYADKKLDELRKRRAQLKR